MAVVAVVVVDADAVAVKYIDDDKEVEGEQHEDDNKLVVESRSCRRQVVAVVDHQDSQEVVSHYNCLDQENCLCCQCYSLHYPVQQTLSLFFPEFHCQQCSLVKTVHCLEEHILQIQVQILVPFVNNSSCNSFLTQITQLHQIFSNQILYLLNFDKNLHLILK